MLSLNLYDTAIVQNAFQTNSIKMLTIVTMLTIYQFKIL